jgi:hypothetical protein
MPLLAESELCFRYLLRFKFSYVFSAAANMCLAGQISQAHQRFCSWRGIFRLAHDSPSSKDVTEVKYATE